MCFFYSLLSQYFIRTLRFGLPKIEPWALKCNFPMGKPKHWFSGLVMAPNRTANLYLCQINTILRELFTSIQTDYLMRVWILERNWKLYFQDTKFLFMDIIIRECTFVKYWLHLWNRRWQKNIGKAQKTFGEGFSLLLVIPLKRLSTLSLIELLFEVDEFFDAK